MENKEAWYEVCINSAGYFQDEDGWSYYELPYAPHWQRDLARKVLVYEGGVFASNEVLQCVITMTHWGGPHIKFARRRMWQITPDLLARARECNAYPRRSDRERAVQDRNDSLLNWLEELTQ